MLYDAACLLCLVVAPVLIAVVPLNVNIMNICFVSFEVDCYLRLIVAPVLITREPTNVNIMNSCFV